jgi:hypothetical protein
MIAVAKLSDKFGNRGWPTQFGWALLIVGFAIFLGAPTDNKPAHFAALILAETGHYGKQSLPTPQLTDSPNTHLTIVYSLHPPNRNLVRQQRRQRIPTCSRRTSRRSPRPSRRVSSSHPPKTSPSTPTNNHPASAPATSSPPPKVPATPAAPASKSASPSPA